MSTDHPNVIRNVAASRLELTIDEETAYLEYTLSPGSIEFVHTFVPESLRKRGFASQLIQAGMEFAEEKGRTVTPTCEIVADYMKKRPETHARLSAEGREKLDA